MRAEDLPGQLGRFRAAVFAQSYHWMNQPVVANAVLGMLEPGGAWLHVSATTHRGAVEAGAELPEPVPPRDKIKQLVESYLGTVRRAGKGKLPGGTPSAEEEGMVAAGYAGPRRVKVPRGEVFVRSQDEIVASVYSLSWAAPHLFGERLDQFEAELRGLLRSASPSGRFAERARDIELVIWRRPPGSPR
jgi:hypothetical protein